MYIILNWRLIACDRIKRRQAAVPEMDVSFFYWIKNKIKKNENINRP